MSKRTLSVSYDDLQLQFCCGIREWGELNAVVFINGDTTYCDCEGGVALSAEERDELRAMWAREITYCLEDKKRPILITAVKYQNRKKYENQCLVDAIKEIPGYMDCGSSVNPGTGNTVTVYMIYPPKKGKK